MGSVQRPYVQLSSPGRQKGGGWLSRFKLIRLRRISLATFAAFGGAHNEQAEVKTKGFIEPKGSKRDFEGVKEWV